MSASSDTPLPTTKGTLRRDFLFPRSDEETFGLDVLRGQETLLVRTKPCKSDPVYRMRGQEKSFTRNIPQFIYLFTYVCIDVCMYVYTLLREIIIGL